MGGGVKFSQISGAVIIIQNIGIPARHDAYGREPLGVLQALALYCMHALFLRGLWGDMPRETDMVLEFTGLLCLLCTWHVRLPHTELSLIADNSLCTDLDRCSCSLKFTVSVSFYGS